MEETKLLTRLKVARIISDVFSPPVVWGALAFPIAARAADTPEKVLLWASIYVFFVTILPSLFIVFMVLTGRITDVHVRVRKQRILPFIVTIICSLAAVIILTALQSPIMPEFALISMIQVVVILTITLFWQISMHAMSITTAVVVTGILYGFAPALLVSPLIPIVGVSRVVLRRHTVAQVIAGGAVGAALTLLLIILLVRQYL